MSEKKALFPALKAEDIQVAVTEITPEMGARLIFFVKGDLISIYLDNAFGTLGWSKEMKILPKGAGRELMSCTITIYDEKTNRSVSKDGVGLPSEWEPEKGEETDAFKRAAYNLGIARELRHNPPVIYIPFDDIPTTMVPTEGSQQKFKTSASFIVESVSYANEDTNDRTIKEITVKETTTGKSFSFKNGKVTSKKTSRKSTKETSPEKSTKEASPEVTPAQPKTEEVKADTVNEVNSEAKATEEIPTFKPLKARNYGDFVVTVEGQLKGKKLFELQPVQIVWLYENNNSPEELKNACLAFAKSDDNAKEVFLSKGYDL